jgi:hypothetical protein
VAKPNRGIVKQVGEQKAFVLYCMPGSYSFIYVKYLTDYVIV